MRLSDGRNWLDSLLPPQSRMALMSSCQPPNEGLFRIAVVVRSIQERRDIRSGGLNRKRQRTGNNFTFLIVLTGKASSNFNFWVLGLFVILPHRTLRS